MKRSKRKKKIKIKHPLLHVLITCRPVSATNIECIFQIQSTSFKSICVPRNKGLVLKILTNETHPRITFFVQKIDQYILKIKDQNIFFLQKVEYFTITESNVIIVCFPHDQNKSKQEICFLPDCISLSCCNILRLIVVPNKLIYKNISVSFTICSAVN